MQAGLLVFDELLESMMRVRKSVHTLFLVKIQLVHSSTESSRSQMFLKIGVINFSNFTGKQNKHSIGGF